MIPHFILSVLYMFNSKRDFHDEFELFFFKEFFVQTETLRGLMTYFCKLGSSV